MQIKATHPANCTHAAKAGANAAHATAPSAASHTPSKSAIDEIGDRSFAKLEPQMKAIMNLRALDSATVAMPPNDRGQLGTLVPKK